MTQDKPLERGDTVAVRGYNGVAFDVLGPSKVWEEPGVTICHYCGAYLVDHDGIYEPEDQAPCSDTDGGAHLPVDIFDGGEWVDGDGEWLDVRMVGDDRVMSLEASTMDRISDDDYCQGCGQIGCGHGGQF